MKIRNRRRFAESSRSNEADAFRRLEWQGASLVSRHDARSNEADAFRRLEYAIIAAIVAAITGSNEADAFRRLEYGDTLWFACETSELQ